MQIRGFLNISEKLIKREALNEIQGPTLKTSFKYNWRERQMF